MSNKITFFIHNKDTGFEYPVDISGETISSLFNDTSVIMVKNKRIVLPENYIKWLIEDKEINAIFEDVSNNIGIEKEELLRVFLSLCVIEDKKFFKTFIEKNIKSKEDYLKSFKEFNDYYNELDEGEKLRNLLVPEILACTIAYIISYRFNERDWEAPNEVIPYIVPITGVLPGEVELTDENVEKYSKDNSNEAKKSFLERFHLKS